jgi:hypothetical protein
MLVGVKLAPGPFRQNAILKPVAINLDAALPKQSGYEFSGSGPPAIELHHLGRSFSAQSPGESFKIFDGDSRTVIAEHHPWQIASGDQSIHRPRTHAQPAGCFLVRQE